MIISQFLYESHQQLYGALSQLEENRPCLIQIFTNALLPTEAVSLAKKIAEICPQAKIIGSSVSGVIYQGAQYDNHTLVVAEQYHHTEIATHLVSLEGNTHQQIASQLHRHMGDDQPALMRLFVGGYYDYAHQLIEEMNVLRPALHIVGGMAGELHPAPKELPFVFDHQQALAQGLVLCTLSSETLKVYGRINTAHEPIGQLHTITEVKDRAILSIENEPAQEWLQRNFGVLSTKEYDTWEDIAQNDPLVRLQLALASHNRAIRFIHYDERSGEISQYFSRLTAGSQFRISYTSPSKCVEESLDSCREVATTPIEQLFCYSCLFRKLYLKNCAQWELSPYHKNPVSGIFLLGEFGYSKEGNALLNGSCVLSGVAEKENYLTVDMAALESLEDIRTEDEKLMDFILRRQRQTATKANQQILDEMIAHESNHFISPYQRMDVGVSVGDLSKYEQDKEHLAFNKLCMVRAENADVLVGHRGQLGYLSQLKFLLEQLKHSQKERDSLVNLHFYSVKSDTFLVASNQSVDRFAFSRYINDLQRRCDDIQKTQSEMPLLLRFVLVRNHPFLLERAYAIMESCRSSQLHVIADDRFEDGELTPVDHNPVDELGCIQLIQYALSNDKVVPYYQGLYNNQTGEIDRYEALMRLQGEDGQIYTPYHFMEISKKYRLYLDLNLKMFQAVLRDFNHLNRGVSINLSVHDILSPRFCQEMRTALGTFHTPSNLTFELLEDECIANMDGIQPFISEVRSYGVKIAIDDFGSGYSSLLEIAKIRPDSIKIDGQIISNLDKSQENESILEAISLLGQRLSIELVAEFVENAAIQKQILAHSIFYSQGYHFARPQPFEVIFREATAQRHPSQTAEHPEAEEVAAVPPTSLPLDGTYTTEQMDFFRAVEALSSNIFFRLNLRTGQMRHFGTAQQEMGVPPVMENFPQSALDAGVISAEDLPAVVDSIRLMRQGVEKPSYFRIYNPDHIANWYRMDYKLVLDQRNIPVEVIGKLTDIQQQKDLETRVSIDPMTGCLRKDAFESLVADHMQKFPNGSGIMFIIDLDNFKAVNDNLGHRFGDRVLRGVGDKLRALFRDDDYVGRIGGDEFMVMLIGTNDMEVGKSKANGILAALDATYTGTSAAYHLSASIGIATYPSHGTTFQTLYDNADMALFDAKNRGKNGYVVYHDALSKGTMENTLPFEVAARTLAQHYDPQVVEQVFSLLFETKEFDISIQTVLEIIGNRFGVSRCYIFELHPTLPDCYQNTYEWCNQGISEEKWRLDEVPLSLFQDFFDQGNGDGVLYCNDLAMLQREDSRAIMKAQGIQSFLHTYITSNDTISYVIGVDECHTTRIWTPIEVSTILQASKIIAQFLSYKRIIQAVQAMNTTEPAPSPQKD